MGKIRSLRRQRLHRRRVRAMAGVSPSSSGVSLEKSLVRGVRRIGASFRLLARSLKKLESSAFCYGQGDGAAGFGGIGYGPGVGAGQGTGGGGYGGLIPERSS